MPPEALADFGAGLTSKASPLYPHPAGSVKHGAAGQMERAFTAASTFFSGMLAISASQFLGAPLKAIDPKFYEAYMAFTKQSFAVLITTMTQWWSPTTVRVSGDKSLPRQLFRKADGSLECRFPKRLVMMANHQLYTDWLYLWWVAYTNNMHGYIYIILKESLKNIPIVGWGAQFYNFIFLSRKWEQDQAQFQSHLDQLNKPEDPMWLLIFPEGTNLAQSTRERSKAWAEKNGLQDMKHQLLPRSLGLKCCLQRLRKTTDWLYDCTIAYEGIPDGQYGQDIFTLRSSMFEGRPPKSVNIHFRRFKISTIPIDNDKAFEIWLRNRWREKDYLLEHFVRFNRFPEDDLWMVKQRKAGRTQLVAQPAKCIQTQIKSNSLEEFLSIFAPLTSVLMVVFLLSGGANTGDIMQMLGDAGQKGKGLLGDVGKGLPITDISLLSNKLAGKAAAPNTATLSDIGRLTPAAAQKELIDKYLNSVRPATSRQTSLPVGDFPKPATTGSIKKAPSVQSQPISTIRAAPGRKAVQRAAPSSVASAPPKAVGASQLRPSQKPILGKQPQKVSPKPPAKQGTASTTSTKASVSLINGVKVDGVKGLNKNKPISGKQPQKISPKPPATQGKASTTSSKAPASLINGVKADGVKGLNKTKSLGKPVTVSPAVLARMKGEQKTSCPKKITVDPKVLAQMKERSRAS